MSNGRICGFCEDTLPPGRRRWCSEACRQRWLRDDNRHAQALGVTVETIRNWRRHPTEQVRDRTATAVPQQGGESGENPW